VEWTRRWLRRLRLLLRRGAVERSMAEEMRDHIERETAELAGRGLSPEEARRRALVNFGGVERFKEDGRDARGGRPVEDLLVDLRYAARVMRRNPAFTAAAVLTFALGVGAATAIFSVVHGVLLRPLPYADPDRLVAVWERNIPRNRDRNVVGVDTYEAWRDRTGAFAGMAALVPRSVTLVGGAAPERVSGAEVSPGYFGLLGVAPLHGRDFTVEEAAGAPAAVVILSHGFWQRRLAADPAVVGQTLPIAGEPHTIVGVMPPAFDPPRFGWLGTQELWFPFAATPQNRAWGRFLLVVARLKPDATLGRARAELGALARQRAAEAPVQKDWAVTVVALAEQISGDVRVALLVLLAGVGLLLLIAITNVATLTLSLMGRRHHELAIRRSLGATDSRIFRQLFIQSAALGLVGSAVGVLAAVPVLRTLVLWLPPDVPRASSIALDAPVLLVTTTVALAVTLLFGTVTARRGRRGSLESSGLRAGDSGRASARAGGGAVVVTEIALGVALSVMALLTARSVIELRRVDIGFTPDGVIAGRVALPGERYRTPASQAAFFDTLLERVRALPGVESAGLISTRPFGGLGPATSVSDPLEPAPPDGVKSVADIRFADPALFRTLRVPLARGRLFDDRSPPDGRPPVVVSEAMASALWPGSNAVGRPVEIGLFGGITADVVGVVSDVHLMDPRTPPRPAAYLQASRFPADARDLIVRAGDDGDATIRALRTVLAELDPTLPLFQVTPLSRLVDTALAGDRFTALVLGGFAATALALAGVGIFGVFSGNIARRRKELGIRLALGATARQLVALVLAHALRRAAIGIAAGAVVALALSRSMRSLLFGVEPYDPVIFVTVALLLFVIAAAATLLPMARALGASPLTALREE
jgi:predicted permease